MQIPAHARLVWCPKFCDEGDVMTTWLAGPRVAVWVFLFALLPGALATYSVHRASTVQTRAEFDRVAELAVDRVVTRMRQHVVALRAGRGLWEAMEGEVSRAAFVRFVSSVHLVPELAGARAIGYAPIIAEDDVADIEAQIGASYGITKQVEPATDQAWRTPVTLVEPATVGMLRALGYDMYAEPVRRAAMDAAIATNQAQVTGPINLVSALPGERDIGFLIYLPINRPATERPATMAPTEGFIYAAFLGQDLIEAAVASRPPLPVSIDVIDTALPEKKLYIGSAEPGSPLQKRIDVELLGRAWAFDVTSTTKVSWLQMWGLTLIIGMFSVAFAGAIAYAIAARQEEAARARELAAAATRESDYRELLVQEMKHRIKNYISRIQSIARQSARGATDVKAFTDSFEARLRAMAAVQEVLAGTAAAQADVRTILRKELQQCLDTEAVDHLMNGPSVRLDERQSHAFGMVVHELVTNAMKYGGLSANGKGMQVSWTEEQGETGQPRHLSLTWREHFDEAAPTPQVGSGFGSRLIDASLKGELQGTLDRQFKADGLLVTLSFPLTAAAGPAAKTPAR